MTIYWLNSFLLGSVLFFLKSFNIEIFVPKLTCKWTFSVCFVMLKSVDRINDFSKLFFQIRTISMLQNDFYSIYQKFWPETFKFSPEIVRLLGSEDLPLNIIHFVSVNVKNVSLSSIVHKLVMIKSTSN